jgi:hypothetical protein
LIAKCRCRAEKASELLDREDYREWVNTSDLEVREDIPLREFEVTVKEGLESNLRLVHGVWGIVLGVAEEKKVFLNVWLL